MLPQWAVAVFFVLVTPLPHGSEDHPVAPVEVVQQYCDFDLNVGRISSANFAKLPTLTTWEDEPGWDTVTVVSGFKIISSKQSQLSAVVTVRWDVLGYSEAENVSKHRKAETVSYKLALVRGRWKIESPMLQPHFKPAILDGKTVRSLTTVAVVFNSVATYPYETALGPISETEVRSDSSLEPEPISVTAASFVRYPPNTRTTGTVVLRAAIDTGGSVERIVAIRDIPALTEPCVEALKRWKFQPAQLLGSRISSSISVAFVLRPPNGGRP